MSMKEANNRLGFYPCAAAKELVAQKMEDELLYKVRHLVENAFLKLKR